MSSFDSEESFFLALNAISEGSHDRAINHLKEINSGEYHGRAQYLLGAEYAEIGMYERAKQFFQAAIAEESVREMAILQKGLLHVFLAENDDAKLCLSSILQNVDEENPLYWFAHGISLSLDAKYQEAIDSLSKGIKLNHVNEPLNQDMQNYIASLSRLELGEIDSSGKNSVTKTLEVNNKFLLTNYKDDV